MLWPILYSLGSDIFFAHQSFKWRNLASQNAVVTVIIVGCDQRSVKKKRLFQTSGEDGQIEIITDEIGPYLIPGSRVIVEGRTSPLSDLTPMQLGNAPYDGGNLILEDSDAVSSLDLSEDDFRTFIRDLWGSTEIITKSPRKCIWIEDVNKNHALKIAKINERVDLVYKMRISSTDAGTRAMAPRSHQFREMNSAKSQTIGVPIRSSEFRPYLPVDLLPGNCCITNLAYAIYDGPVLNISLIGSRLHLVWVGAVCGRMKTDFSYSNKMGWHTFPVPKLTEKNREDLTRCAEDILLAREAHFPATIADLYDLEKMPANLRAAHERNDETLERIYIGRRFKNDTERLEKLFDMYTKMTTKVPA